MTVGIDGGIGPDVGILDAGPGSDDGGAADRALADRGTLSQNDAPADRALLIHGAADFTPDVVKHQPVGFQQIGRFTGVFPPAGDFGIGDFAALIDQVLVGVGNFELAPGAGLDAVNRFENRGVVDVDTGHGKVTFGSGRFFLDPQDAPVPYFRNTETLGIGYLGQDEVTIGGLFFELVHETLDAAHDDVVAQVEDKGLVPQKWLCNLDAVRQSGRSFLRNVGQP